jgi:RNA polymerase sigma factor (sigma-70 family)
VIAGIARQVLEANGRRTPLRWSGLSFSQPVLFLSRMSAVCRGAPSARCKIREVLQTFFARDLTSARPGCNAPDGAGIPPLGTKFGDPSPMSEYIDNQEVSGVPKPRRSHSSPTPRTGESPASGRKEDLAEAGTDDSAKAAPARFSDIPSSLRGQMHDLVEGRAGMIKYFQRRGIPLDDATMLTHDTLEAVVHQMVHGIEPVRSWRRYSHGIARNLMNQYWRRRSADSRLRFTDDDDMLISLSDAQGLWEDLGGNTDRLPALFEMCIDVLSKYQMQVLGLKFIADLDYSEIGEILGRTEEAVRRCYSDAIRKIRSKPLLMARILITYRRRTIPYDHRN